MPGRSLRLTGMGAFRIPAVRPVAPPHFQASPGQLRILVVDDYPDAAETLAFLLGMDGHEVRTATDGGEAIAAATWFHPDVIVLDISMPGMDGFEVAGRIRAIDSGSTAHLIAMTGYASRELRNSARNAGFDEFLVKPVTLTSLRDALANYRHRTDAATA
ncbi:response regulator [Methylotetracoccus oryzae]|uniref:response regulator n=1 Tax=Methylotetracoccus oryzae TaxID=1919059 RepID=UPI001119497E|nr:response regulator [Methylotetracoccus oryzae]